MLPLIEARLKDPDHTIREYALDYYLELRGPRAREVVLDALEDENDFNRMHAFGKLRDHLEPGMLPLIEARLKDPDHTIREYAAEYSRQLTRR
jgi:HEAT repeat protein